MLGSTKEKGLKKSVSNLPPLTVNATLETPGLVPVTLTDALTVTSPVAILPVLGVVKQTVTLYAPDGGVLVAQVLFGTGVAVGVGVLVGRAVAVGLGVFVGFGVCE
jgi:hypothetical protein